MNTKAADVLASWIAGRSSPSVSIDLIRAARSRKRTITVYIYNGQVYYITCYQKSLNWRSINQRVISVAKVSIHVRTKLFGRQMPGEELVHTTAWTVKKNGVETHLTKINNIYIVGKKHEYNGQVYDTICDQSSLTWGSINQRGISVAKVSIHVFTKSLGRQIPAEEPVHTIAWPVTKN